MNLDIGHWMRPGILQLPELPPLSLYVHLPWCLKKCPYCDFNSHVRSEINFSAMLESYESEITFFSEKIVEKNVKTIFIVFQFFHFLSFVFDLHNCLY